MHSHISKTHIQETSRPTGRCHCDACSGFRETVGDDYEKPLSISKFKKSQAEEKRAIENKKNIEIIGYTYCVCQNEKCGATVKPLSATQVIVPRTKTQIKELQRLKNKLAAAGSAVELI